MTDLRPVLIEAATMGTRAILCVHPIAAVVKLNLVELSLNRRQPTKLWLGTEQFCSGAKFA